MKKLFKKLGVVTSIVALSGGMYAGTSKADEVDFVELPSLLVGDTSVVLDLNQNLYTVGVDTITITRTDGVAVDSEVIIDEEDPTYNNDYLIVGLKPGTVYHFNVVSSNGQSQLVDLITNPAEDDVFYSDGITRTSGWDLVAGGAITNVTKGIATSLTHSDYGDIFGESTGGDVKFTLYTAGSTQNTPNATARVDLFENDGSQLGATFVKTLGYVKPNSGTYTFVYDKASSWLDGSNKRAEFEVRIKYTGFTSDNGSAHIVPYQMWD